MNTIIDIIGKFTGLSKLWDCVNGYKTKIGGIALMFAGLAEMINKVIAISDIGALVAFAKSLPTETGWITFAAGLAALGLGHKIDKATDSVSK